MTTPEITRKIEFQVNLQPSRLPVSVITIPDIPNSPTLDLSFVPSFSVIAAGANTDSAVASDAETLTDSESSPSSIIDGGVDLRRLLSVSAFPIHERTT